MQFSLPGIDASPMPNVDEPERIFCPSCERDTRKVRAEVCPECCHHPRRQERRLNTSLFCLVCRSETATGLGPYRPRSAEDRESDEANDRWHAWFDSMG